MKRTNIFLLLLLFWGSSSLQASDFSDVLEQVRQNNTLLASLRKQADAEKIGTRTGLYPENPEVEYHYLWGNQPGMENRNDITISQTIDFPTAYYHRKKVSDMQSKQLDVQYYIQENEVLLETQRICIELVYRNILLHELETRLEHARQIRDAYQAQFDVAGATVLDLNKAKLNFLSAQKEYNDSATEQQFLFDELARLNGGNVIAFTDTSFQPVDLPMAFDSWYEEAKTNNLELQLRQMDVSVVAQSEKLQRSLNLPKISAGYMNEGINIEGYHGLTLGVSIPLFENKNTVKQLRAQNQAAQAARADADQSYYNEMKALYNKAYSLWKMERSYRESTLSANSAALLKQALDAGEISLIEYVMEQEVYYEMVNALLETARDLRLVWAEMNKWM